MRRFVFLLLTAIVIIACETDNKGSGIESKEVQCNLSGFAQKGQFVKGSQVTAFAVGADMVATGESFPANISDDLGSFAITGRTEAPYLELRAEGYYFNEMTGEVSSSPMYLEAFVRSDDRNANINILTTIARPRIKRLIASGKSYENAAKQAQQEILSSKFISDIGFSGGLASFDELDIIGTGDADAMLFILACRILYDRSASQVTTLVQELASELESDGEISYIELVNGGYHIDPYAVLSNLGEYYSERKLGVTSVPPFWKYCGEQYQGTFVILDNVSGDYLNNPIKSPDAITQGYNILADDDFKVEADGSGVNVEKTHIFGPAYHVVVSIPANETDDQVVTKLTFKDKKGQELATREFVQGADLQYLVIYGPQNGTKAIVESNFGIGDEISVNGASYTLEEMDFMGGQPGIKVKKADSYIVSCPAGKVSAGGHIARARVSLSGEDTMSPQMYYYGALAPYSGFPVVNPGYVRMQHCLAAIGFRIGDEYERSWSYIEVSPNAGNEYLAGTASFVVNESEIPLFSDLNPYIDIISGIHTKRINNDGSGDSAWLLTFPQELSQGFTVRVFDASGKELISKSRSQSISLQAGKAIVLTIQ